MPSYTLISIMLVIIASIMGFILVRTKHRQQPKQVKIILFGVYSWGMIFFELGLCALVYYLTLNK
jgi:cytochrome c biogenesis protein ResB